MLYAVTIKGDPGSGCSGTGSPLIDCTFKQLEFRTSRHAAKPLALTDLASGGYWPKISVCVLPRVLHAANLPDHRDFDLPGEY